MPTFTAIALDTLLEHGTTESAKSRPPLRPPKPIPKSNPEWRHSGSTVGRKILHPKIKPSLYTTPEVTPLPDSPTSFPPSPYIINHKRRGPRLLKILSGDDVGAGKRGLHEEKSGGNGNAEGNGVKYVSGDLACASGKEGSNGFCDGGVLTQRAMCGSMDGNIGERDMNHARSYVRSERVSNGLAVGIHTGKISAGSPQGGRDSEGFYEPWGSSCHASNLDEGNDRGDMISVIQGGEFYDAYDEMSSDGGTHSSNQDIEAELCEMRLSLLMEIESRNQAEEALKSMQKQWEKIRKQFLHVGLTLPADPISYREGNELLDCDAIEELCQQVTLSRCVSESIGRSIGKAEAEMEMEARIELKNFEIARLTDRLNYYEAMNREMSQRNQEAVEMARRNRQERKSKHKWIWGSVAVAITIGTAALLWSHVLLGKGLSSTDHPHELEKTDSCD